MPELEGGRIDPAPAVEDILATPGTAREVDALECLAERWVGLPRGKQGGSAGRWLEPACGTGRYLRVLAARGRRIDGFDCSAEVVQYAQRRLRALGLQRRARVFTADMRRFADRVAEGSIDFAFNLHNTIRILPSDAGVLVHWNEMARVLRPRGLYAVGISLTRYGSEAAEEDVWTGRRGRCTVRQVVQYLPPGVAGNVARRFERVVSHLAIERPAGVEHRDATYALRCYDEVEWARLIGRSALRRIATVDGWGRPVGMRVLPYAIDLLGRRRP